MIVFTNPLPKLVEWGLAQTEALRRSRLLRAGLEAILGSERALQPAPHIVRDLYWQLNYLKNSLPADLKSLETGVLEEKLYRLKYDSFALRNIPKEVRRAYGDGMQILDIIAPEKANFLRQHRPRSAYQNIAGHLTRHPLDLIGTPQEIFDELDFIIHNAQRADKTFRTQDGLLLDTAQWDVMKKIRNMIDLDSIAFHHRAIPLIVEHSFRTERVEADTEVAYRLVRDITNFYNLRTSCDIQLVRNDGLTDADGHRHASARIHYDQSRRSATIQLTNFDVLEPVQKFLFIAHEVAAHLFRYQLEHNPDYKIPIQAHIDGVLRAMHQAHPPRIAKITVSQRTVAPVTTNGKTQAAGRSNYESAVSHFGTTRGFVMYRYDCHEREADMVEHIALQSIQLGVQRGSIKLSDTSRGILDAMSYKSLKTPRPDLDVELINNAADLRPAITHLRNPMRSDMGPSALTTQPAAGSSPGF